MSKKVDLTVLNKLVAALNEQMALADNINPETHGADRIVEISKAIGLAGSISSEATFLISDIAATGPKPKKVLAGDDGDLLASLFGPAKKNVS